MTISREEKMAAISKIDSFKSANGGFNRQSFLSLGLPFPPKKGWLTGLVRKMVAEQKGATLTPSNPVVVATEPSLEDPF